MRKLALLSALLVGSVGLMGAAYNATQIQSQVSEDLQKVLHVQFVPGELIGGPMDHAITQKTIDTLTAAMKAKKKIVVDGEGKITLK